MRYVLSAVCAILALGPSDAVGEETTYGSYRHHDGLPNVLLLVGEIDNGDSFELRRAMRDHQIDLVVAASRGGSVYEGLQMASILRDKDVGTYIPDNASCESSCASVFLGGSKRMVIGELGVHQFYSGAEDARSQGRKDVITTVTQYTTSDIIGILNEFDTPPFVYEKMFRTTEIYYFDGAEKQRIGLGISDETFVDRVAEVDDFLSSTPGVLERTDREPESSGTAQTIPPSSSAQPSSPDLRPNPEKRFENTDFFGMDLSPRGLRNVSLYECENFCRRTDACAAWSYVHATRWCWPKSGVENISLSSNVTSGITDPGRINPEIFSRPFLEATGLDIRGYDLYPKGLRNMTLDQCRHACQATSSCVAWSYVPKKSWCFPKHGVGRYESRLGIVSGIVKAD
ncbi:PAN domain-containing protein [Roseovarius sp. S1116L3]|uniref:PAN domain-containing protein n=1 Tax=Roseovarius roseus TaxID=3342636 RepID=UPI00372AADBC